MGVFEFIISLVAMVLGTVTVWIVVLRKDRRRKTVEPETHYQLSELASMAESMRDRIDILESILDAEVPNWRDQNESGRK